MDPYIGLLSKNKNILYSSIKNIDAEEIIRNLLMLDERSRSLEYRDLIYNTIKEKTDNPYKRAISCYLLNLPNELNNIDNIDIEYKRQMLSTWRNGNL